MKKLALCESLDSISGEMGKYVSFFWSCNDLELHEETDFWMGEYNQIGIETPSYDLASLYEDCGDAEIIEEEDRNILKFYDSDYSSGESLVYRTVSLYNAFRINTSRMKLGCWFRASFASFYARQCNLMVSAIGSDFIKFIYHTTTTPTNNSYLSIVFEKNGTASLARWETDIPLDNTFHFIEMGYYSEGNDVFCDLYIDNIKIGETKKISFIFDVSFFTDFSCRGVFEQVNAANNFSLYNIILSQNYDAPLYALRNVTEPTNTVDKLPEVSLNNMVLFYRCMTEAFEEGDYFPTINASWYFPEENPITVGAGMVHTSGWKWDNSDSNPVSAWLLFNNIINYKEGKIGFWFKTENMVSERSIFNLGEFPKYVFSINYDNNNLFTFSHGGSHNIDLFEYSTDAYVFLEIKWYFVSDYFVELSFTIDGFPVHKVLLEDTNINLPLNFNNLVFAVTSGAANNEDVFYFDNIMISNASNHNLYALSMEENYPSENSTESALVWYWRCDNDGLIPPQLVWDTDIPPKKDFGDVTREDWDNWDDYEAAISNNISIGNGSLFFSNEDDNNNKSISFTLNNPVSIDKGSLGFFYLDETSLYYPLTNNTLTSIISIKLSHSIDNSVSFDFVIKCYGRTYFSLPSPLWEVQAIYKQTIDSTPITNVYRAFVTSLVYPSSQTNNYINIVWNTGNLGIMGVQVINNGMDNTINTQLVEQPSVDGFDYDTITITYDTSEGYNGNVLRGYLDNIILLDDNIQTVSYAQTNGYPDIFKRTLQDSVIFDSFLIPEEISRFNGSISNLLSNEGACFFNPTYSYEEDIETNESILTSKDGRDYIYKKDKHKRWNIPIEHLPKRDSYIINKWREYNKELYFIPNTSENVYYRVKITNNDNPFGKMAEGPYWDTYYEGDLLLEEISGGILMSVEDIGDTGEGGETGGTGPV